MCWLVTRRLIIYNIKTKIIKLCYWTVPQRKMKMSTETLLWLESTGSAVPVREVLWWKLMVCCYGDTPVHSCWPPVVHCALPHCKQQPEEGKGDKRDVHMRALSLCNLELYVRDTVFQASIYRSIHMAIHFCEGKSNYMDAVENFVPNQDLFKAVTNDYCLL